MTIIWTLNCFFFMLYAWPTKQVFCLYLRIILDNKSFWMYCSLNQSFWRLKKSSTSCPNWGGKYFCSLSQFRPLSLPQPLPSFLSWELGESDIELKCWLTYGRRLCAAVCILTCCCCCLCLGKLHCWADTGKKQEKKTWDSKYSIFLLFVADNHILIMIMRRHSTL